MVKVCDPVRSRAGGLVSTALSLQPRATAARCVLCHDALGSEAVTCPDCGTLVHEECQLDRCPTLGCASEAPWEWVHLGARGWRAGSPWRQPLILLNCVLLGLVLFGVTAEWAVEAYAGSLFPAGNQRFFKPENHPSLLDSGPLCYCAEHASPLGGRRECSSEPRWLSFEARAHELQASEGRQRWTLLQGTLSETYLDSPWGAEFVDAQGEGWIQEVGEGLRCLVYCSEEREERIETPAGSFLCTYTHVWTGSGDARIDRETWTAPGISAPIVTQLTWRTPGAPPGFHNVRRSVLQSIGPVADPSSAK